MIKLAVFKPISFALVREIVQSMLLVFFLSVFILFLLYLAPGEYILEDYLLSLQENISGDEVPVMDFSFVNTYIHWFSAIIHGNFGVSSSNGMPVLTQVMSFTWNTFIIIFSALLISLIIALPMAIFNAKEKIRLLTKPIFVGLSILSTFPLFWLCYISIYLSGKWLDFFPLASDFENITLVQFILPVLLLSLGSGVLIEMIQLISSELKRVLNEDYLLYARAKGASILFHALKEGIIFPLLNLIGNRVAYLFGASIIVEQIFNWPGIGRILWQSAQNRDIALLLSAILVTAVIIRVCYFTMRVIYILINPRASHE